MPSNLTVADGGWPMLHTLSEHPAYAWQQCPSQNPYRCCVTCGEPWSHRHLQQRLCSCSSNWVCQHYWPVPRSAWARVRQARRRPSPRRCGVLHILCTAAWRHSALTTASIASTQPDLRGNLPSVAKMQNEHNTSGGPCGV